MANSVAIHSIKASLVRLCYGQDVEVDHQLESRVHDIVSKYVLKSDGRQITQFLIQPVLTALTDFPERPAPFNTLQCLLVEFQKWKKAEPVLRAAAETLKTLVGLFSTERLPSLSNKVYSALSACISLLDGRLKPPAVDGVASACFIALESKDWTHKVGALEVLATLVRCSSTTYDSKENNQRTLLTDFLDLAAITAQRQAHYDPSEHVREAAFSLLSTIECPVSIVDTVVTSKKDKEKTVSAESVEPLDVNSTSKDGNNDNGDTERLELPVPLALTPLPAFSKELSEDELCLKHAAAVPGTAAAVSPSINSVSHTAHYSPDAFSMLGSDMKSINSAIEMEVENFLRGSILPVGFEKILGQQRQLVEEDEEAEEDVYSDGWDDVLNPVSFSYNNNNNREEEEEEERVLGNGTNAGTSTNQLLGKALEEHFNEHGSINFNLTTQDIENILRNVLDLHSEQAYEHHLQRAEALLVRSSQQLQGERNADIKLQRQVQLLEKDVHRAVAEQQAQFMECVVPEIADILANPQILERLLGFV
jgi:hypothetical protein